MLALVGLLAGCGAHNGIGRGPTLPTEAAAPVDFPVDAKPRPIVLIGPRVEVVDGYRSDGEKVGAMEGGFEFVGTPPATPEPAQVTLPDGPAQVAFLPMADALQAVSAPPRGKGQQNAPVRLVSAEFGTAEFSTDRGRLPLPAWRFTTEAGSVLATPALAPDLFWKLGEVRPAVTTNATGDGVDLTVSMPAAPTPCPGDEPARNEPVVTESATAVTVTVRTVGTVGDCPRTLALTLQPYPVKLASPLGNRLLVDGQGGVVAVTKR
ncbi:hypothetical protein DFJ66_6084 [Saccharothrix variisporea]|uniref:Uncharacterized protein n=1 Tax=Saccharothrix variisporea TaxID=543527 RepID=A0A495XES4_9PSEU|nr:hypothetical protein DFJ66_6084 [Saccharothrix variisporea]